MRHIKKQDFKNKYRKEWQDDVWRLFLKEFSDQKFRNLADTIFSAYEKKLIINRIAAVSLIREGVGTQEIARLLWLSRSTISAIKNSLFSKSVNYGSQRSFKGLGRNTRKLSGKAIKISEPFHFLDGVDLLEILKNPPRPKGLGVTRRSDV